MWEPPNVPNPEYKGDALAAPAAPPAAPPPAPQREAFRQLLEHYSKTAEGVHLHESNPPTPTPNPYPYPSPYP